MRSGSEKIVAILCADIHLSLNPPIWRSAEPDWFEAMSRPLEEIKKLQREFDCPVICAGDIFDKWNSPPELINFALDNLPNGMIAIPGQHDLPLHKYEDIEKSAYWTLVRSGKIIDISPGVSTNITSSELTVYGFPYGEKVTPISAKSEFLQIAVIHEYVWIDGKSYPDAPVQYNLGRRRTQFKNGKILGYDTMVYGDNHIGFIGIGVSLNKKTEIFNCGTLMRRNSDEINYLPQVGLLLKSGEIQIYCLDTTQDKHLKIQSISGMEDSLDMKSLIQELEKLGNTDLDFHEAMKEYLRKNKVNEPISTIILKAMGM